MMDETDRKIIDILEQNARIPFTEIAEEIGVSEATVRKRVKVLEEEDVIKKYTIEVNPQRLGYQTVAIIGLDVEPENLLETSNQLSKQDQVKYVATSTGDHMIMFEVWAQNNQQLNQFISNTVGKLDGVKDICPAIILEKVEC